MIHLEFSGFEGIHKVYDFRFKDRFGREQWKYTCVRDSDAHRFFVFVQGEGYREEYRDLTEAEVAERSWELAYECARDFIKREVRRGLEDEIYKEETEKAQILS